MISATAQENIARKNEARREHEVRKKFEKDNNLKESKGHFIVAHGNSFVDRVSLLAFKEWGTWPTDTGSEWNDHLNLWNRSGKLVCITGQPYADQPGDYAELLEAARVLRGIGFTVFIDRQASWHYPECTALFEIWLPSFAPAGEYLDPSPEKCNEEP